MKKWAYMAIAFVIWFMGGMFLVWINDLRISGLEHKLDDLEYRFQLSQAGYGNDCIKGTQGDTILVNSLSFYCITPTGMKIKYYADTTRSGK